MARITRRLALGTLAAASLMLALGAASAGALGVSWMNGQSVPGTPAKYDKVGVIKVGPSKAHNVLVLEPGTSAGGSYFVPLAQWIVQSLKGWQVWSVERRENLLEDQSYLNLAKRHRVNGQQLFDYYLGWLTPGAHVQKHFQLIPDSSVQFAKQWGMNVAVQDLHRVIAAAKRLHGRVVLGGHSLGGTVVTAYATWNFNGHPGANDLAGLVYIDGGSRPTPVSAQAARQELQKLDDPHATPWLSFGGIGAPFAGLYNATGSTGALLEPNAPSLGQSFPLLPKELKPSVRVTNLAEYGYALNVRTSPRSLIAAQAHLGRGLAKHGNPRGWDGTGALTPIKRFATMFSGIGLLGIDGTEWYFPQRLTDDTGAVANGNANPAQSVLDLHSTMGHSLSHRLQIYAFGARLGGQGVLDAAKLLAKQSHIPTRNLVLINRHGTYAHNDPNGAYPHNVFFSNLVPFLRKIAP